MDSAGYFAADNNFLISKNTGHLPSTDMSEFVETASARGRHRSVVTRKQFPACSAASGGDGNAISRSTTLGGRSAVNYPDLLSDYRPDQPDVSTPRPSHKSCSARPSEQ